MENQSHCLTTFQRKLLLKSVQADLRPEYRRRIEIMLLADQGQSHSQICTALRCSHQTARYWIAIAQAGKAHHWNARPIGPPKAVNDEYLNRLKELVSQSPQDYGYAFKRWTGQWLCRHVAKELGIEISDRHVNRLLKNMGLSTQRPCQPIEKTTDSPSRKDTQIAIRDLPSSLSLLPYGR